MKIPILLLLLLCAHSGSLPGVTHAKEGTQGEVADQEEAVRLYAEKQASIRQKILKMEKAKLLDLTLSIFEDLVTPRISKESEQKKDAEDAGAMMNDITEVLNYVFQAELSLEEFPHAEFLSSKSKGEIEEFLLWYLSEGEIDSSFFGYGNQAGIDYLEEKLKLLQNWKNSKEETSKKNDECAGSDRNVDSLECDDESDLLNVEDDDDDDVLYFKGMKNEELYEDYRDTESEIKAEESNWNAHEEESKSSSSMKDNEDDEKIYNFEEFNSFANLLTLLDEEDRESLYHQLMKYATSYDPTLERIDENNIDRVMKLLTEEELVKAYSSLIKQFEKEDL
mmetsp:Transcript_11540/g.13352  ORF Transcript_11540/g.13352 Transcript_11540/m.13352 type:complete len:337 (+) Transcript_11540:57-1067(+)|eukprot:CAMPEP_0184009092 /NCGR_PEP_ID=MMETSP0954-20121128/2387_1 /TAXON_ID=627963 /ORGANISM="Aplanochytrium sp, Strain PBS07" /LENGTH=336 /DNA_ID=CAMNT_0026288375 /DNA_START=46 /DNA_END=1056 /DNA_ORIENTATION=-